MQTWEKIKEGKIPLDSYFTREKVIDHTRDFFKNKGFHEIFTPILVPIPSCEPNLEVFQTVLKTSRGVKRQGYLIMSPEYSIKKLLAAGIGNCFEITKCFRNDEEVSSYHNPEFTMLEWYRVNADYMDIMDDFEQLFTGVVRSLTPQVDLSKWQYQKQTYDLTLPWTRITVSDAFAKYAGVNTDSLLSEEKLFKVAVRKGYKIEKDTSWEEIFYQILFNEIEPKMQRLNKPYFLYDYPVSLASLSRKKIKDPRFAERFEVFLAGVELGNCFSELIDAKEQEKRFKKEMHEREMAGKSLYPIDKELIRALSLQKNDVAGIAVGLDRLIMLAGDFESISETLFFPAKEIFDLTDT